MAGQNRNINIDTTAAGVAVPLSSATASVIVSELFLQAKTSNGGIVQIGAVGVSMSGSNGGITLVSGQPITFNDADLTKIFIDTTVSGEGITGFAKE